MCSSHAHFTTALHAVLIVLVISLSSLISNSIVLVFNSYTPVLLSLP